MNKNLFKTFAIAAMTVLAGACAKEQVGSADGETVEMTFNVDVPETTITTKGLSDSKDVNEVICQVFLSSDHTLLESKTVDFVDGKANVSFSLVKGQRYDFAFWAQVKGTGYYDTSNLSAVKIDYSKEKTKANDATRVAFFRVETGKKAIAKSDKVTLTRAFAQVNFGGILDTTRPDAIKGVSQSKITMTNLASTIDLFNTNTIAGFTGNVEKVTFDKNPVISGEKLNVNGADYQYFATVYVPAPSADKILTDAVASLWLDSGFSVDVKAPNVPIKRNYRTNILGNFFNDVEYGWTITIDDRFGSPDFTYDAVSTGLAKGTTVTLSEDYKVLKDNWSGINIPVGVESVLNLNGHRFANEGNGYTADAKSALVVKGKLTINGDGDVFCEGNTDRKPDVEKQPSNTCISVLEGGHLIINGGNYSVGTDVDNKCNATIYVENIGKAGKVEIYGGTFTNAQGLNGHSFVLNQDDQLTEKCITVYGGTFIGFNPADNTSDGEHTNYVAEGYRSVKISDSPETWKVEAIPAVTTQEGLNAAIADVAEGSTATVNLGAGEFTTYDNTSLKGKNVTVSYVGAGADKTTFAVGTDNHTDGEANGDYSLDGVTKASFKNMTIKVNNDNYRGYIRVKELEFENCVFENRISYWGVGEVTFKNCTFNQTANDYNLWTYSGTKFVFENCTFNAPGKFINVYKEQNDPFSIIVRNCKFIASVKKYAAVNLKYGASAGAGVSYRIDFYGTNVAQTEAGDPFPLYGCSDGVTTPNAQVFINDLLVWKTNDEFPTE